MEDTRLASANVNLVRGGHGEEIEGLLEGQSRIFIKIVLTFNEDDGKFTRIISIFAYALHTQTSMEVEPFGILSKKIRTRTYSSTC